MAASRLPIPALFHAEALSGFLAGGHMVFPSGTGLAAGWSPDLVGQMSDLIRRQMRRTGMQHALSPVLDVALDPRWGRVHETFGEDPYLCAALGVAYVARPAGRRPVGQGVMATGKHFLGYAVTAGRDQHLGVRSRRPRRTRDLFAYPFEAAIRLAGLRSVMNSYADVDGVPAGASPEVLQDLLRDTLGFDGFVSSDYGTARQVRRPAAGRRRRRPPPAGWPSRGPRRRDADRRTATATSWPPRWNAAPSTSGMSTAASGGCCGPSSRSACSSIPIRPSRSTSPRSAAEGSDLSQELARRSVVLAKNNGSCRCAPRRSARRRHRSARRRPVAAVPHLHLRVLAGGQRRVMRGELGTMNGADDVGRPPGTTRCSPRRTGTASSRSGTGPCSLADVDQGAGRHRPGRARVPLTDRHLGSGRDRSGGLRRGGRRRRRARPRRRQPVVHRGADRG